MPKASLQGMYLLALAGVFLAQTTAPAAERVILVSADGLRPDAIEAADTPTIDMMIAGGAYFPFALCDLPSATLPNHTSMVTGVYARTHGVYFNQEAQGFLDRRTIFSIADEAGLACDFFASKTKLGFLAPPELFVRRELISDTEAMNVALLAALVEDPADLIFVHYRDPDSAGHRSGWMGEEYLQAVERVDGFLGQLLEALAESGLLDETALIVTADHGGIGTQHALNIAEVRHIPWIAYGAGIAEARLLCQQINQPDTAATVLMMLGLAVPPDFEGQAVEAARAEVPQSPCQPIPPVVGPPCVLLMIPLMMTAVIGLLARGRGRRSNFAPPLGDRIVGPVAHLALPG